MKMEGNLVSSSSTAIESNDQHKLNREKWKDDLCSNIYYTKPWYRAEIGKLEAEIFKLESSVQQDKESFSTDHFEDILPKLINKLSKDKQASLEGLDVKRKLNEDGEIDIKRLERFTGLNISNLSLKIEEEKGEVSVRRHRVEGNCRGVEFQTTFLVKESILQDEIRCVLPEKQEVGSVSGNMPQITSLDVSIENETASLNMKAFLEYVQEEKQLQQFFVTLENYTKWKRDRSKTFNHFQKSHPVLVTYTPLRDESCMTICNKQHPSLRVNVIWKILVTRGGDVKQCFDLQSCFPVEQLGNDDFPRKMRTKFLSLLKNLGIEKSIELIILTMAK